MSMIMGRYSISQTEDELTIQFPDADKNDEIDLKFKIKVFAVWAAIFLTPTLVFVFSQEYATALLFVLVLGVGGMYLCINLLKRSKVQFFHLKLDAKGIHEIWTDPEQPFEKHISWEELNYFGYLTQVVWVGTGSSRTPYDFIVFSKEEKTEKERQKQIRKTFKSSMQFELKFKEIPDNIFLLLSADESQEVSDCIYRFVEKHVQIQEEPPEEDTEIQNSEYWW